MGTVYAGEIALAEMGLIFGRNEIGAKAASVRIGFLYLCTNLVESD